MNSAFFAMRKPAGRLLLGLLAPGLLCLSCGLTKAEEKCVKNGGFEQVAQGVFADWQYGCDPAQVKPRVVSGVWQKLTCNVMHEPGENAVRIYFWALQGATGSIWVDNITVTPPVPGLRNLSFEETGADDSITGWNYPTDGVAFSDSTRSSDGKKSLRIALTDGTRPDTSIWQEMPMEPGKEYTVTMDCFVGDDFVGTAQGYILGATPPYSTRQHNPLDTKAYPPRPANEKTVCALMPLKDKPAELSQRVSLQQGANLEACVEIENAKLKGDIKLAVEDAASKKVLAEMALSQTKAGWYVLRVPFASQSSEAVLRVAAQGEGEVQIDNVAITPPQPTPPLQQVEWRPSSENFHLASPLKVAVEGKSGAVLDQGLSMLAGDLKAKFGLGMEKATSGKADLTVAIGERYALQGKGDESYSLKINRQGMAIEAGKEPGAFYGVMTMLQLLAKVEGVPVVLACSANDYPDMPMRGVLYGDPEQAARWKMNTLMYSSGYPTEGRARAEFADYVAKCQRLNLNLIPYFLTLDGGVLPTRTNPNLASGVWVKGEKVVLRGTTPSELANKYVIRTGLTDVTLTSVDGKKQYRLGADYQVIAGDIIGYPYEMANPKPFAVVRTEGSAIPDGATVLASYDYVSRYRESTGRTETHIPYCPVEPQAREIMGDFVKNLAKDFPFSYMHITSCLEEFGPTEGMLATDSRCIKSGKTPIELLADSACFLDKAAKSGNPTVRISVWAGHVNEYSKAVGPKLPKDAMVNIWGYDAGWPVSAGRASIEFWSKLGITTSVMPWYDVRCVDGWAQVVAEARAKGYPCLGMIDSCWLGTSVPDTYGGIEETAIVSWKVPQKGDARYVELAPVTPAAGKGASAADAGAKAEPAPAQDGLVGYWSFDKIVDGKVPDSSGNGNDGAVYRATLEEGVIGSCISFAREKGAYVDCGSNASLNIMAGDFTIMFWVKAAADAGGNMIARGNAESGAHGYWSLARKSPAYMNWSSRGTAEPAMGNFAPSSDFHSGTAVYDGTWHHAAFTKTGTDARWYVDGVQTNTTTLAPKYTETDNLMLGTLMVKPENIYNWTGSLDELRMYGRALSAEEVKQRYDADWTGATGDKAGESAPIRLASGTHLFIDDFLIAESANLTRTTHQPEKLPEPVIRKGESWHIQPLFYMRVARDAESGLFRAWYNVKNPGGKPDICYAYAESNDGIKWRYPDLGLVTVGASAKNNLIDAPLDTFSLFMVDDGPESPDISRRYKMAYFAQGAANGKNGTNVAFSADSLRWRSFDGNPVQSYDPEIGAISDVIEGCWDPLKKEYLLVCKTWLKRFPGKPHYAPDGWRRCVGMSVSKDFIRWPRPAVIVAPDPGNGLEEFYGFKPMVRGNLYIGFLRVLRDDLPADAGGAVEGIGWTELVTSRDGRKWTRHQDKFIDRNLVAGAWDHAMAWFGDCLQVGDREYIYYGGYSGGHKIGERQIGLGFLRKDGFVSRDAGDAGGSLRTPPVVIEGSAITANADVAGEFRARITDEVGKPLPGFDWEDCQPIRGDSLRHALTWKNADLPALGKRPVRLEFKLRQAKLYALDIVQ